MATWRDGAEVFVEIAFGNDPLTATASCTWDDVTSYVRGVSISRGRSTELATYSPGTASILLDNRTRIFDPSNTAGTYYGELLPMKRIRVRAASGVTSAVVFTGYVLGWPIEYPGMKDSVVQVSCVDAFRVLEQAEMVDSAYTAAVLADSPDYYWPLTTADDATVTPAVVGDVDLHDYAGSSFAATAPVSDVTTTVPVGISSALTGALWVADDGALTGMASPKTVEAWLYNFQDGGYGNAAIWARASSFNWIRVDVATGTHRISLGYSNTTDTKSFAFAAVDAFMPSTPTHVVVTADTSNVYLYLNGRLEYTGTLSAGTSSLSANPPAPSVLVASLDTAGVNDPAAYGFAVYPAGLSASQVAAHYVAGITGQGHPIGERAGTRIGRVLDLINYPTADRDLSTGDTVLGPWYPSSGSALSQCQACATVDQGLFFIAADGDVTYRDRNWQWSDASSATSQATFGDNAGETPYGDITIDGNDIEFVRNVVTVSYTQSVTVKDAASVAAYGPQSDSVSASLLPSRKGWLARQLAAYRLRSRKDPKTRVPMVRVAPRVDTDTHLPTLITLELGERVTVNRRPTGGTGSISVKCSVQGIQHSITPDNWETTLYLAPAPTSYTEGPYLTLGDATYGKIGAVAGNLIPY